MKPNEKQYSDICQQVIQICRDTGEKIRPFFRQQMDVQYKSDKTPFTQADLLASQYIIEQLQQKFTWPVISEEAAFPDYSERGSWSCYWLVDPIDGTKEFIKGNTEFTINIALIIEQTSVLGVVYASEIDELYYADKMNGAYLVHDNITKKLVVNAAQPPAAWRVTAGKTGPKPRLERMLTQVPVSSISNIGSSLKVCRIAANQYDLYPRFGPTSEWDTAASQIVLEMAGGALVDMTGNRLKYNQKDSLINPNFLATSYVDEHVLQIMRDCS